MHYIINTAKTYPAAILNAAESHPKTTLCTAAALLATSIFVIRRPNRAQTPDALGALAPGGPALNFQDLVKEQGRIDAAAARPNKWFWRDMAFWKSRKRVEEIMGKAGKREIDGEEGEAGRGSGFRAREESMVGLSGVGVEGEEELFGPALESGEDEDGEKEVKDDGKVL